MWPLHRDTKPIIARTPPAWANQHIILVFSKELPVDLLYFICYRRIINCRKVIICFDIDHIDHILRDAMTKTIMRTQKTLIIRYGIQIFIKNLLGIYNRTNLQEIELTCSIIIQVTGKFDFYRTFHLVSTKSL